MFESLYPDSSVYVTGRPPVSGTGSRGFDSSHIDRVSCVQVAKGVPLQTGIVGGSNPPETSDLVARSDRVNPRRGGSGAEVRGTAVRFRLNIAE